VVTAGVEERYTKPDDSSAGMACSALLGRGGSGTVEPGVLAVNRMEESPVKANQLAGVDMQFTKE